MTQTRLAIAGHGSAFRAVPIRPSGCGRCCARGAMPSCLSPRNGCPPAIVPPPRRAGVSLADELAREEAESRIARTEIALPPLFALQLGLVAHRRALGLTPDAVIGHRVGEIAAAHVAGTLDLESAVRVIHERSRWQGTTAVFLQGHAAGVVFAADDGPASVTIAGDAEELAGLERKAELDGVFFRLLRLDYAFHSPVMDAIRAPLLDALDGLVVCRMSPPSPARCWPARRWMPTIGGATSATRDNSVAGSRRSPPTRCWRAASRPACGWTPARCFRAAVAPPTGAEAATRPLDVEAFYRFSAACSFDFGTAFRLLKGVRQGPVCSDAVVRGGAGDGAGGWHPAQLDAGLQATLAALDDVHRQPDGA